MSDQQRPEVLPDTLLPPTKFMFTTKLVEEAKRENDQLIEHYRERVRKISSTLAINDMQIIPGILSITHDKQELKRLAKGIDRVADLQTILDELETRGTVLEYAGKDPVWFAAAFADLEHEVDQALPDDQDLEDLLRES